jgi:peptidyl-prolyl cis-trans isomerase D
MAVLAKIRQRSALLIGAIAIALFAFIIQDLIGKGGLGQNTKDVGSINEKDIAFEDFRLKVTNLEKVVKELLQLKQLTEFGNKKLLWLC